MTGWQGSDDNTAGNQGWQQQPQQQPEDPYAYDPADPYGYGHDPYAQYPPQYSTGSFAAQGPPPPPPKRSKLPMILSLVAIVIIVGAVVGIILWDRNKNEPSATPGEDTSETRNSPSERPPSERNTSEPTEDWTVVDNKAEAGLTYSVPPDWTLSNEPRASGEEGIEFGGVAEYGTYDCEGDTYVRSFAASGDVQGRGGTDADPAETVKHFAGTFATEYFGDDATVEISATTARDVDGKATMTVTATVTADVTKPACQPATAEVTIMGVPVAKEGQANGVSMVAVVNAVEGGPDEPKPTTGELTEEILATVSAG